MYKQSLLSLLALSVLSSNSFADYELEDIMVSAKSSKSIKDLSEVITVITAEDIERLNATNIKDALIRTPGVIKSAAGAMMGGRESISIRGLDSTYSLILVDGKKINPTDDYIGHSDFQYSWVPIDMIERIEVMKGPKSSIFGSQAIGGVINIITKKDKRKIYGEVNIQGGISSADNGGDENKISASLGGNISDKLFFFLGANKNERDPVGGAGTTMFGSPTNEATYIEGLKSKDIITKLRYSFDDTQSVYASYIRGEEERKDYDDTITYDLDRDIYSVGYEKKLKDISFSIDYSRAQQDSKANSMFAKYTHKLESDLLKAETKISMLKNNYIIIGAETSKDAYDRTRVNGTNQYSFDARANAYYLQDEIDLGDFIFTFGGRYDDNKKYGNEFSPNIGVVYKIDDYQRLKASYGEGFKAPSVTKGSNGFGTGSHGAPFGNDNLEAETSKSYELAYELYTDNAIFKSAIFRTDVDNMIKAEGATGNVRYENIDEVATKGFELGIEYAINDNHMLNANYTFIKTEDKQTRKNLTYKPKHTINVGLSSEFGWGISSYISANYVGSQYSDGANENKAEAYTIYNAQISKDINKDLSIKLGIDNITNEEFDDNDPYYLKRRVAYVGLNYKF
ncbi:TonB-dependent receptor domain-containing protein [Halarcobacter sp.]|uniref:TonB-dependent receptor plug domain-containing protein n=1 Tax=Halarcobacter sp. TaxID=2321133 RepID=UPI002AAC0FCF|nr:TonB-dependent receptor [Halarcobacter sp.]